MSRNKDDLMAALTLFAETLDSQERVTRPKKEKAFGKASLEEKYFASSAVELLSDPLPSFYGHKEATFAGFSAWVIAPKQSQIRIELIALSVAELLANAEEHAEEKYSEQSPLFTDLVARYIIAGPQFIEQIYTAIGGMFTMSDYGSRTIVENLFLPEKRKFHTLVQIMASCHYVSDQLELGKSTQHSLNKAISAVSKMSDHDKVSRAYIYTQWSQCKDTIAWIYSAQAVQLPEKTLLEVLLEGAATFDNHGHYFQEWAGKAKYFLEHVLKNMPSESVYTLNRQSLSKITPVPFDFSLNIKELSIINEVYKI